MVNREPGSRDTAATGGRGASVGQPTAGEQVQQAVGQVADQAQHKAGQVKEQVVEQVTTRLDSQKEQATGSLGHVAHAFRQTGQQLREGDQGGVADYVDQVAEKIEAFTGYLRRQDVSTLYGEVERFSRREPALFLGGAFALGLLGARFLKSSAPPPPSAPARPYGGYAPPRPQALPHAGPAAGLAGVPPVMPPSVPPVARSLPAAADLGMSGRGVTPPQESDVIVGGPPITDALVGGPPRDTPRTGSATPGANPAPGRPAPTSRSSGDAGA